MIKKPAIKANSTSLRAALETKASSAVILRHAMHLTITDVIAKREAYQNLKFEIKSTQRSLDFWEQVDNFDNKQAYINSLKTRLKQYSTNILTLENPELMLELRKTNEELLKDNLQLLIISLLKYYQTTEQIPNEMIGLIADRIIWKFGGLSLEDVAVCFNMAMNGDLGKVYNRIDGGVIMSWLQDYSKRQQEVLHQKNVTQHLDAKGSTYKDYNTHRKLTPKRLGDLLK